MEKLEEYINAHMVYPESLKKSGKEGRVLVKFVVDANGYVKDVAIQQTLDPAADQAVLNLVNGMNANVGKWRPARKEGKSFDAEMVLPVTFSLGTYTASPEPLKEVDEMARFPGCEQIANPDERNACAQEKMFQFVYSNIKYPKEDREKNIEGTGIVQFVIGVDGRITDIEVLRSPGPGITSELFRLMNAMAALPERWIPAMKDGKVVPFQLVLPVKFKLQDDQKEKVELPVSSPKTSVMNSIKVSPNPAQEFINVSYFEGTYILKIFDTSGNLVLSKEIASDVTGEETISISSLKPGQYVIQVISDTKTMSSSFVKI
jgi:TonB family protein